MSVPFFPPLPLCLHQKTMQYGEHEARDQGKYSGDVATTQSHYKKLVLHLFSHLNIALHNPSFYSIMIGKMVKIRQLDKEDCAAACLASISYHYGLKVPISDIRRKCGTTIEGTSIKGILEAASSLKFEAFAYKNSTPCYTLKHLTGIPLPSILHFKNKNGWLHFVVLYRSTENYAIIMDPSDGEIHKMGPDELLTRWTGYLITISPAMDFRRGDSTTPFLSRFLRLLRLYKGEIIPSLAGSIIYVILGISFPLYLQFIIDRAIPAGDTGSIIVCSALVLLLIVTSLFIGYIRTLMIIRGGVKMDGTLIMGYIRQIMHLPTQFFKERSTGEIHSRIGDIYKIRGFISGKMTMIIISVLALFLSFFLLFSFQWRLALITFAFVPLYILVYFIADKTSKRDNRHIIESAASFDSSTIETISNIETVKNFSGEEYFYKKIEEKYSNMGLRIYRGGVNNVKISTAADSFTHLLSFTIVTIGTLFVFESALTTGELVSFFTISSFFTSPLSVLIEGTNDLNEAKIAFQRVFEILDMEREDDTSDVIPITGLPDGDIKLEEISFRYTGKRALFEKLSFTLRKGKITTIMGENGCGKSTLASLLMRSYSPSSGNICIGNLNINQFALKEWRKYISIIPQQDSLFDGNVLENIVVGDKSPNIDRVTEICESVGMIDFIKELPKGLLSPVGEGGRILSGGERVKIALARALYRDPQILIMDEVTSHLDMESCERIYTLSRYLADNGVTVINISHDQRFVEYSDYVVNLNKCGHTEVTDRTPYVAMT